MNQLPIEPSASVIAVQISPHLRSLIVVSAPLNLSLSQVPAADSAVVMVSHISPHLRSLIAVSAPPNFSLSQVPAADSAVVIAFQISPQLRFLIASRPFPNRSLRFSPIFPRLSQIASRISLPNLPQSVCFRPSHMAATISGILAIRSGIACTRPTARLAIISTPAGISSGSAAMMPSSSPFTSCMAASASCGMFWIRKSARLRTRFVASSVMGPMLSVIAVTSDLSRSMAAGSSVLISPGSRCARAPTACVRAPLITGSASVTISATSSSAPVTVSSSSSIRPGISSGDTPSWRAAATLPMDVVAASTSGLNAGIITRPMEFLRAVPVALNRCIESSKAPIFCRFSSLNTVPMAWASLPRSFHALLPASIRGLSSLADFPNRSMAMASRSASLSILPSASMASQNTSSVSRRLPFESR